MSKNPVLCIGSKFKKTEMLAPPLKIKVSKQEALKNDKKFLQRTLVYAANLPLSICEQEILKKEEFFGQYGPIRSIICVKPPINNKNTNSLKQIYGKCYVTYENEKDSALAIIGFNNIKVEEKILHVTYGTNKFCIHFTKGNKCLVKDCFYMHNETEAYFGSELEQFDGFRHQERLAKEIIRTDLKYYCQKLKKRNAKNSLYSYKGATLKEIIERLVQERIVFKSDYQKELRSISGSVKSVIIRRVVQRSEPQLSKQIKAENQNTLAKQQQQRESKDLKATTVKQQKVQPIVELNFNTPWQAEFLKDCEDFFYQQDSASKSRKHSRSSSDTESSKECNNLSENTCASIDGLNHENEDEEPDFESMVSRNLRRQFKRKHYYRSFSKVVEQGEMEVDRKSVQCTHDILTKFTKLLGSELSHETENEILARF